MKDAINELEMAIETHLTNGAIRISEGFENVGIENLKKAARLKLAVIYLGDHSKEQKD